MPRPLRRPAPQPSFDDRNWPGSDGVRDPAPKHENRNRLVPAPDRQGVRGRPGPVGDGGAHDRAILAQMRGPVHRRQKRLNPGPNSGFLGEKAAAPEGPSIRKAVSTRSPPSSPGHEGLRAAGGAVHEMRENPVETVGLFQKAHQPFHPVQGSRRGASRVRRRRSAPEGQSRCRRSRFLRCHSQLPPLRSQRHAADRMAPVQEIKRCRLRPRGRAAERRPSVRSNRSSPRHVSPAPLGVAAVRADMQPDQPGRGPIPPSQATGRWDMELLGGDAEHHLARLAGASATCWKSISIRPGASRGRQGSLA